MAAAARRSVRTGWVLMIMGILLAVMAVASWLIS